MSLQNPSYMWLLLLLVPIAAVQVRGYFSGRKSLRHLYGMQTPVKLATVYYVKWFFSSLFFLGALASLILAAAGIGWGRQPVEDARSNLEVVFVVDVSYSMFASDVQPTRLSRSIELMRGVITGLPGVRFGVTAFKGEGVSIIPVTENRFAFDSLEHVLVPDAITAPWTHIDKGLQAGVQSFPHGSSRNQVIVLFSDGENQGRSPLPVASELGRRGIPVAAVTVGTIEGGAIPIGSDDSPLRDSNDQVIMTRADTSLMQNIANNSGGEHFHAMGAGTLGALITFLEQQQEEGLGFRLVEVPRNRVFIALGLLLLVLHELVRIIRWKGVL